MNKLAKQMMIIVRAVEFSLVSENVEIKKCSLLARQVLNELLVEHYLEALYKLNKNQKINFPFGGILFYVLIHPRLQSCLANIRDNQRIEEKKGITNELGYL